MARDVAHDAVGELAAALSQLRVQAAAAHDNPGTLVADVDGRRLRLHVAAAGVATAAAAERAIATSRPSSAPGGVLVADRVPPAARAALEAAGWGWFERQRGHLHLFAPGLRIDADVVAPTPRPPGPPALTTAVSREVTAACLLQASLVGAHRPLSVRAAAAVTGRSVGAVAGALKGLRAVGLLGDDATLLVPETFWALAGEWSRRSHTVGLAAVPDGADADTVRPTTTWALRGPRAAAAWGAPAVIDEQAPVDLYVPNDAALRSAVQRYGAAPTAGGHAATVTVAPTPLVLTRTFGRGVGWLVVHPVFAALDLATDLARGKEILDDWNGPGELADGTAMRRIW